MPRERTPEEIDRLKRRGIIDVGTEYIKIGGWDKLPRHKYWDGWVPPDERKARKD